MGKKPLAIAIGIGVFFALAPIGIAIYFFGTSSKKTVEPSIDLSKLKHDEDIVGHWKRVAISETDPADGFRQIAASGKMATCYGDMILDGSFKIIDHRTIETAYHCHGEKDEINQWIFGFLDGKLIMVNQSARWVEAYERVPVGTLHPSIYP